MKHGSLYILLLPLALMVGYSEAFAEPPAVLLSAGENSQNHQTEQLVMQNTDIELLKELSPHNLQQAKGFKNVSQAMRAVKNTAGRFAGNAAVSFAPEFAMFSAAVGAVAVQKLLTDYDSNPDALKIFWERQVTDPFSWISFYTFIIANRTGSTLYEALALKLSWIRDEKLFVQFMNKLAEAHFDQSLADLIRSGQKSEIVAVVSRAEALLPKPRFNSPFSRLKSPMGLASGIFLNGLTYDFISDHNIRGCAMTWLHTDESLVDYCELAFEDWVLKGKIVDYAPQLLGAFLTSFAQMGVIEYLLPKSLALVQQTASALAETKPLKRYEFKGLRLVFAAAGKVARLKPMVFIGSTFLFLEMSPHITDPLQNFYEEHKLGDRVLDLQNKIETFKTDDKNLDELLTLLEDYGRAQNNWREYWLKPAKEKIQAWTDYVSGLQADYLSTKNFYEALVQRISSPELYPNLSKASPYFGLDDGGGSADAIGAKIVSAVRFAMKQIEDVKNLGARADEAQIESLIYYHDLIGMLMSIDDTTTPTQALQDRFDSIDRSRNLDDSSKKRLRIEARETEFVSGIHLIQKLALMPGADHLGYTQLNKIFSRARPLGPGGEEILDWNETSGIVIQKSKMFYPFSFLNFELKSKSEYLLAEFVCGDDPNQPKNILENFFGIGQTVSEFWGVGVQFRAPRLVSDEGAAFCRQKPVNVYHDQNLWNDLDSIWRQPNGKEYYGLVTIASRYLKNEFRGADADINFQNFWNIHVDNPILLKLATKEKQFDQIIDTDLHEALTTNDVYRAQLNHGIYLSLMKEFSLYLSILKKVSLARHLNLNLEDISYLMQIEADTYIRTKTPEDVFKFLTRAELGDLTKRLTAEFRADPKISARKALRIKTTELNELFDKRIDSEFGTFIEASHNDAKMITALSLIKLKLLALKMQFEVLQTLEQGIEVDGLNF